MTTATKIKTADQLEAGMNKLDNTSKKIRYLHSEGLSIKQIYNFLKGKVTTRAGGEIRYQHVRNIVKMPIN